MKTKKLIAILTIVALMMTLIPMAAFGATSVGTPTVTLEKNLPNVNTDMTITFVATNGIAEGDTITVVLPDGYTVAEGDFDAGTTLNGTAVTSVSGTALTRTIAVKAANAVAAGKTATLFIEGSTKITNPTTAAENLTLSVSTTKDNTAAASSAFGIRSVDRFASSVTIDTTSVPANDTSVITMTVYAMSNNNKPVAGQTIEVATSRPGTDKINGAVGSPTVGVTAVTDLTGKATFTIKSAVAGTAQLAAGIPETAGNVAKYLVNDTSITKALAGLIDNIVFDINFTATAANTLTLSSVDGALIANGIDTELITATLTDSVGNPVANATVNFTADVAGATFTVASGTTNAVGQVATRLSSTTAGTINVTANSGSVFTQQPLTIIANAGGAYSIELVEGAGRVVATGTAVLPFKFKVTDINGNMINNPVGANSFVGGGGAALVSKPTGSTLTSASLNLTDDLSPTGYAIVSMTNPDKAGTYTIRLALPNGKAATVDVTVKDQGAITGATAVAFEKSLAHRATSQIFTFLVDAEGVSVSEPANNFTWSSSNTALADVNANGLVKATDVITRKGTVTITGIHKTRKYVVSVTYDIGAVVAGISATADKVMAGETATVTIQLLDDSGNPRGLNAATVTNILMTTTVISKPDGANVTVASANTDTYQKGLSRTGSTTINVKSDKAGVVKLAVTVDKDSTSNTDTLYTAIVDVEFGAPKVVVGAKNVTMFIGAPGYTQDGTAKVTDVAPFIKDGRTFVAVRPIAEAFDAEVAWNEATQTVTLTRADITVTIVIGSNAITVVRDGVTSTVTADVPAFIVDGRTVLPFRAVGEAFGATVNYDAATQSVSFVQG